jgi:D-tyrosyl-tRNA(Tyr) deacylase
VKALLQRVSQAQVTVDAACVGEIGRGLLVLLGLDKGDDRATADRMVEKLLAYRVFADADGRMNSSVVDVGGGVLLVSQFTLSADTRKGLRPSFSSAMPPHRSRCALRLHPCAVASSGTRPWRRGCLAPTCR